MIPNAWLWIAIRGSDILDLPSSSPLGLARDGDIARAEAAIAVTKAAKDVEIIGVAFLLAGDWEAILLKEHVVEMDQLADDEGLLFWCHRTWCEFDIVNVCSGAHSPAARGAVGRLQLGDLGEVPFAPF